MSPAGEAFWSACAEGRLIMPRCDGCGRLRWYLQPRCPRCRTAEHTWVDLSGRARLYTWTVVHRAFDPAFTGAVPYISAFVTPVEDDDVRLVTRIVGCEPPSLVAGMPLAVTFEDNLPLFRPETA